MRRGISNIILAFIIMLISTSVIILMNNYMNSLGVAQELIIDNIDRRFKVISENVELVENDSAYILRGSVTCPIKYLVIYDYSHSNISIIPVYNYLARIDKNLLKHYTELYAITCNGNIVRLYVNKVPKNYIGSLLSSIRWGLFQPGRREFIDPTVCPVTFNKYVNSYGFIEVNASFSLYCYNRSGLVLDSPILYFYNTFLAKSNDTNVIKLSLFSKGIFRIEYGTHNIDLFFLGRIYDLLTNANIVNISYPSILNLQSQLAVQESSKINGSSVYRYAWDRYPLISINGKFLIYLDYNITAEHLTTNAVKVDQGIVITDRTNIVAPSTLKSVKFYLNVSFFNNSSFIIRKLPLDLRVNYTVLEPNSSYRLVVETRNGTVISKEMNKTDILLIVNKSMYRDKYVTIILEKIWLYKVSGKPAASVLIKVISRKRLLSILAYKTKEYLKIYTDSSRSTIKPRVVQKYYDGKILSRGDSTELFIQGYYTAKYSRSPVRVFSLYLPYIVVVLSNR